MTHNPNPHTLFDGLECFGFETSQLHEAILFNFQENNRQANENGNGDDSVTTAKTINSPDQFLYIKELVCPVCGGKFYERIVKKNKLRLLSTDRDLKPNFEQINPLIYDVHLCNICGYAALNHFFSKIRGRAVNEIKAQITPSFKAKQYPLVMSIDEGIERHKLALFNAIAKKAKDSEKAYICMRIAWLYRDNHDKENEQLFLKNACEGFINAFSKESFPMCGISENTMTYIIAAFYYEIGNMEESLKWLSTIITSKTLKGGLKEKAVNLKQDIRLAKESEEM